MKKTKVLLITLLSVISLDTFSQDVKNSGYQQFKIGNIEACVLTDGYIPTHPVQPTVAPMIDSQLVNEALAANYETAAGVDFAINILLLKKDNHFILFDAGDGNSRQPKSGWLIDNLAAIGVEPGQITDIVVTHAHPDHVGGLVDKDGNSIFPNATIYISRTEFNSVRNHAPDYSKSLIKDEEVIKNIHYFINSIIGVTEPQMQLVEDGETILDCITIEIAPGHTEGHIVSTIFSEGQSLVHIADVVHMPLLLTYPEWGCVFDQNFEQAIATRKDILRRLDSDNALVFSYHLPYPGIGHLKKISEDSYSWMPSAFATPQSR